MATNKPTITEITDTFTGLVTNLNTISLDLGATGRLNTNEDSDAVSAINELEFAIRGTSNNLVGAQLRTTKTHLVGAVNELDSDIGDRPHTTLTTDAKTLTGAINELESELYNAEGGNKRGLSDLGTNDKTCVVDAINELETAIRGTSSNLVQNQLNTTKTHLVGAINELDSELGTITSVAMGTTATTVSGAIAELDSDRDRQITYTGIDGTALTTSATNLTTAVNELDAEIGAASLNTSATTLRGAINELHGEVGDAILSTHNTTTGNIGQSLNLLDSAIGDLSTLTVTETERATLVEAINANKAQIDILDSDGVTVNQTLGLLTNLSSGFVGAERNNFVAALNALRADIPLIFDENGTQLN